MLHASFFCDTHVILGPRIPTSNAQRLTRSSKFAREAARAGLLAAMRGRGGGLGCELSMSGNIGALILRLRFWRSL